MSDEKRLNRLKLAHLQNQPEKLMEALNQRIKELDQKFEALKQQNSQKTDNEYVKKLTISTAKRIFLGYVPTGDIDSLCGKDKAEARQVIISTLTGQKLTKVKATNAALRSVFFEAAGIKPDTIAEQNAQFAAWALDKEQP